MVEVVLTYLLVIGCMSPCEASDGRIILSLMSVGLLDNYGRGPAMAVTVSEIANGSKAAKG